MSAARGLGVAAVLLGLLLMAGMLLTLLAVSFMGEGDPEAERFEAYVRSGVLWTLVPIAVGTMIAGGGLMAHRAWARPMMLALAPWHVLSGIGIPVAIAAMWLLTTDEADQVLA